MVRVGNPTVSPVGRPTCTARCPPPSLLPPGSDRVGPWSGTSGGPGAQKKHPWIVVPPENDHVGFVVFPYIFRESYQTDHGFYCYPPGKDGNSISPAAIVNGCQWLSQQTLDDFPQGIRTPRWCRCPPPRPHLGKLLPSHRPLERGRNPPRPRQHRWMVSCYNCVNLLVIS